VHLSTYCCNVCVWHILIKGYLLNYIRPLQRETIPRQLEWTCDICRLYVLSMTMHVQVRTDQVGAWRAAVCRPVERWRSDLAVWTAAHGICRRWLCTRVRRSADWKVPCCRRHTTTRQPVSHRQHHRPSLTKQRTSSISLKKIKNHARVIFHPFAGTPPLERSVWILAC